MCQTQRSINKRTFKTQITAKKLQVEIDFVQWNSDLCKNCHCSPNDVEHFKRNMAMFSYIEQANRLNYLKKNGSKLGQRIGFLTAHLWRSHAKSPSNFHFICMMIGPDLQKQSKQIYPNDNRILMINAVN